MSKNALVTYATKSGSTAEVAQAIGDTLSLDGTLVTIEPITQAANPDPFDFVLIGSPIINGKCMAEVRHFMNRYYSSLREKPIAFFVMCMRLGQVAGSTPFEVPLFLDPAFGGEKPRSEMNFMERVHPVSMYLNSIKRMTKDIEPASIAFFRGVLDYSTIGFMMVLLFKFMVLFDGLAPRDYRNWEAIRSWTRDTYSSLQR